jgi:hypothetical protein
MNRPTIILALSLIAVPAVAQDRPPSLPQQLDTATATVSNIMASLHNLALQQAQEIAQLRDQVAELKKTAKEPAPPQAASGSHTP